MVCVVMLNVAMLSVVVPNCYVVLARFVAVRQYCPSLIFGEQIDMYYMLFLQGL
jgi:hypothetical protein